MLHAFVTAHRDEIVRRCRSKGDARSVLPAWSPPIDHGVPAFLDQLVEALRSGHWTLAIGQTAGVHGCTLLRQGFSVSQVVHEYGDVCQSITELAVETSTRITATDFRVMSACLDIAIAGAVTEYERQATTIPRYGWRRRSSWTVNASLVGRFALGHRFGRGRDEAHQCC